MTEEQVPLTREFTIEPGYARRAAWAFTRWMLIRPLTGVLFGIGLLAVVPTIVVGETFRAAVVLLSVAVPLPVVVYILGLSRIAGTFRRGKVLRVGFGQHRFRTQGIGADTSFTYAFYGPGRRVGDFVVLGDGREAWSYFPGSLFTDEDLARFVGRADLRG